MAELASTDKEETLPTRSAAKAYRQSLKRRLRNRTVKSATKTCLRRAEAAFASGDLDVAREAVRQAISALDRAAKKGVLHPNNVARRKSGLVLKYNAAVAAVQAAPPEPAIEEEEAPKRRTRRKKSE